MEAPGRPADVVLGLEVGAGGNKPVHHCGMAIGRRMVQRCPTSEVVVESWSRVDFCLREEGVESRYRQIRQMV